MGKHIGIIVTWLAFTLIAFAYVSMDRLVAFDASGKLEQLTAQQLSTLLQAEYQDSAVFKGSVIHFSKDDCRCSKFTEPHVLSLAKLAENHSWRNFYQNPVADSVVETTPAVAIFDGNANLVYFGPYGQGIGCSEATGFAQTVLNNHMKGYLDSVIISAAKGCYC